MMRLHPQSPGNNKAGSNGLATDVNFIVKKSRQPKKPQAKGK